MQLLDSFKLQTSNVESAAFSADCHTLVTLSGDRVVRVWDLVAHREIASFRVDDAPFYGHHYVDVSADGTRAIGGGGHVVVVWDVAAQRALQTLKVRGEVSCVRLSADGRIASGNGIEALYLWNVDTGSLVWQVAHSSYLEVQAIAFVSGASTIIFASKQGLGFAEIGTTKKLEYLSGRDLPSKVECVVTSPSGRHALSGGHDGDLVLWNTRKQVIAHRFDCGYRPISSAAFSSDGSCVLTGGQTLRLWGCRSGRKLAEANDSNAFVVSVAFTPDGMSGLSVNVDGQVAWRSLQDLVRSEPAGSLVDPEDTVDTAIELIQRVLRDGSFDSWKVTQGALGTIDIVLLRDERVRQFVPSLLDRLQYDQWHNVAAAAVLGRVGDARAVKPLIEKALEADNLGPVRVYLEALSLLDPSALAAMRNTETVVGLINDIEKHCATIRDEKGVDAAITEGRIAAIVTVLGEIGDRTAVPSLLDLLTWQDDRIVQARLAAAEALGRIGDPRAVAILTTAVEQGFASLKEASRKALEAIKA